MAYCRCGDNSDLYVYGGILGYDVIFCVGKKDVELKIKELQYNSSIFIKDVRSLLDYLTLLQDQGFKIPAHTFERIEKELKE